MILMGAGTNHYYHSKPDVPDVPGAHGMCGARAATAAGPTTWVRRRVRPGWGSFTFALDWAPAAPDDLRRRYYRPPTSGATTRPRPPAMAKAPDKSSHLDGEAAGRHLVESVRR